MPSCDACSACDCTVYRTLEEYLRLGFKKKNKEEFKKYLINLVDKLDADIKKKDRVREDNRRKAREFKEKKRRERDLCILKKLKEKYPEEK